jgi:hypothetical protein
MATLINNSSDMRAIVANLAGNSTFPLLSSEEAVVLIQLPLYYNMPVSPKWHAKGSSSRSVSVHKTNTDLRALSQRLVHAQVSQSGRQKSVIAAMVQQQKDLWSRETLIARQARQIAASKKSRRK